MNINLSENRINEINNSFKNHNGLMRKIYDDGGIVAYCTACKIKDNVFIAATYADKKFSKAHCKTKNDINTLRAISQSRVLAFENDEKASKYCNKYNAEKANINYIFCSINEIEEQIKINQHNFYSAIEHSDMLKFERNINQLIKLKNFFQSIVKYYDKNCNFYVVETVNL